jgi:hypothetical protein
MRRRPPPDRELDSALEAASATPMTRSYAAATPGATALGGAVGGTVAGLVAAAVLSVASVMDGQHVSAGLNALGAWSVRWLQTAGPDAIEHFYWDATLGGAAYAVLAGALCGALFALVLSRLPEDHPLVWGGIAGVGLWVAVRWVVGPALDPVLVRVFDWHVLLPTCLAYGLVLGRWVQLARGVAMDLAKRV